MTGRSVRKAADTNFTRRKSSRPSGRPIAKVNDRVEIWWDADETYYRGTLTEQFKPTSFRILYDDGETEDVDLTNENWRFAVDTSTQSRLLTPIQHSKGQVVEIVLDGSDHVPPQQHPSSKHLKPSKKEQTLHSPTPTSMHIDTPSSHNPPKSVPPVTKPFTTKPADIVPKQSKPSQGSAITDQKKAKHTNLASKMENKLTAIPSDSSKTDSAKPRPKQKFARIRKDSAIGATSKSKTRRTPSNERETPAKSTGTSRHSKDPLRTDANTVEPVRGLERLEKTTPKSGAEPKQETLVQLQQRGPAKGDSVATPLPTGTVSHPRKITGTDVLATKGKLERSSEHRPPGKAASVTLTHANLAKEDNTSIGKLRPELPQSTMKDTTTKQEHCEVRPESLLQDARPPATVNRVPTNKPKTPSGPCAQKDVKTRSESEGAAMAPSRPANTSSLHESDAGRRKGIVSHEPHKSGSKESRKDLGASTDRGSDHVRGTKKEDSYRSRSSSERPSVSAVADKKRKRKKTAGVAKSSATNGESTVIQSGSERPREQSDAQRNGTQTSDPAPYMAGEVEQVARKESTEMDDGSADKTRSPAVARGNLKLVHPVNARPVPKGKSTVGDSRDRDDERSGRTSLAGSNALQSVAGASSGARPRAQPEDDRGGKAVSGQGQHALVKNGSQGSAHLRQKRDRLEDVNPLSSTKRARTQTSTEAVQPGLPDRETHAAQGRQMVRREMAELGREIMSSVSDHLENVSRDVKGLVSMSLKFRQDAEFYKDVVHRSVIEEGGSVRSAIQELKDELLAAFDDRARQTEYRIMQRVHEALASRIGSENRNTTAPVAHRHVRMSEEVRAPSRGPVIPQSYPNGGVSRSPDTRLIGPNPERLAPNALEETMNERNDSPTAIANVNQSSARNGATRGNTDREALKESEEAVAMGALAARVSHLVARQVTVWLLETPHEYNPGEGPVFAWAERTATSTFEKVADKLRHFNSFMQAYQILCSSLGNDAVELQWFVTPGVQEHLRRARRNYAAWDPPPSDEEWMAEMCLLRELSERFDRAMQKFEGRDVTMIEACVQISQLAAYESGTGMYHVTNGATN